MSLDLIITLSITVLGGVWALFRVLVMQRIERLEKRSQECISEADAKELVHDKIEPMKEDLREIRIQINKLFDRLIKS